MYVMYAIPEFFATLTLTVKAKGFEQTRAVYLITSFSYAHTYTMYRTKFVRVIQGQTVRIHKCRCRRLLLPHRECA